jgi:Flp pilus assembly protein TadG
MNAHASSSERGVAAIEFALVLPLLILLIFGMIEFGRAYNAKITVTHAAREGVRELAITDNVGAATSKAATAAGSLAVTATAGGSPCSPGGTVTMTVAHSFSYNIPFFGTGSINLSDTAQMRCGG